MNNNLVSIIISAYNAEKYIRETIESAIAQTWQPLEIIVVNDGSKDNTAAIVSQFGDQGVKLIEQTNAGQDAALNNGFRYSTGKFLKFLDSDDLLNPEMIERQMQVLQGSDCYVAYSEWSRFFDDNKNTADFSPRAYWKDAAPLDFLTAAPEGVMLQCGSMLIPRAIIERAGEWDERISLIYNDTEFFTRQILASKGVKFSPGAQLFYRSGNNTSMSSKRRSKAYYETALLAAELVEKTLLVAEDSPRTRRLISNMLLMQYCDMYPRFPELATIYKRKIDQIGHGTYVVRGGKILNALTSIVGWKMAKRIQLFLYGLR